MICPQCSTGRRRDGLRRGDLRDVGAPTPAVWASAKLPRLTSAVTDYSAFAKARLLRKSSARWAQSAPRAKKTSQK